MGPLGQAGVPKRSQACSQGDTKQGLPKCLGHGMGWVSEFIRPGRLPGMQDQDTENLVVHTFTVQGEPLQPAVDSYD